MVPDRETLTPDTLLATSPNLERLFALMRSWWEGQTLSAMAKTQGLSRQRVNAILTRVGCTRRLWHAARHDRADSPRHAAKADVLEARELLSGPHACQLTIRQRCALAWRAQGLVSVNIAKRMAVRPPTVRGMLISARWRMERFAAKAAGSSAQAATETIDTGVLDNLDLSTLWPLLEKPTQTQATPSQGGKTNEQRTESEGPA